MDVKIQFTAVDSTGALASAASDKLEGVTRVIVLGSKAWMFSSEDINQTVQVRVQAYAEDRAMHEELCKVEDAAFEAITLAVGHFASALIEAQNDRLKIVEAEETREHQRLAAEEKQKLDQFIKKPEPSLANLPADEVEEQLKAQGLIEEEPGEPASEAEATSTAPVGKPGKKARKK
jgi:hypothetical protein